VNGGPQAAAEWAYLRDPSGLHQDQVLLLVLAWIRVWGEVHELRAQQDAARAWTRLGQVSRRGAVRRNRER
jgi:hypothetical protein